MHSRIFNLKSAQNNKASNILNETFTSYQSFFNAQLPQPIIIFINSRNAYNKLCGRKTESWEIGHAEGKLIIMLSWNAVSKSERNWESYKKVLKHEYAHVAYRHLTGHGYPKWLNEGLACYLAGQKKKSCSLEDALSVFDYFSKSDKHIYNIGYHWVNLLVNCFGKKKILKLVKQLECEMSEDAFKKAFFNTYAIRFSERSLKKFLQQNKN